MELQLTRQRAARQSNAGDSSDPSSALSEIRAGCQRVADAAQAEIDRALNCGVEAEEFLSSAKQLRGGQ
jgi:hypothetical protein